MIEKKFQITYLSKLEFYSEKILKKVQCRAQRKLKKKGIACENFWTLSLFREAFLKGEEISYCIAKVNPLVGYGVFANKLLPSLTYVGEYTGVVRKRTRRKDTLNDYVFGYVVGPDETRWVIDARKKGNFTRWINHSFEPNLTSKWMIIDGVTHIILFTNRLVYPKEQLTYDYGPYYWRKRSFPQSL